MYGIGMRHRMKGKRNKGRKNEERKDYMVIMFQVNVWNRCKA
jgi:hypothetical protein